MPAFRSLLRFVPPVLVVGAVLPVLGAAPAGAVTVTPGNPGTITIPSSGNATPYPSTINVSSLPGAVIGDVNVQLNNMNHTFTGDVDILLVGPTGESVVLATDSGGFGDWVGTTMTFDDGGLPLPCGTTNTPTGTYSPTNCNAFSGGAPAPAGPYGSELSTFDGTDPNGTWSLYVFDDTGGDSGSITNGWTLIIRTAPTLSVSNVSVVEGNSGTTNLTFTLSLSEAAFKTGSVDFYTSDGTAKAGSDFQNRLGTRVWTAGQKTKKVTVPVFGETAQESNETFTLNLLDPDGINLLTSAATGTILDDDAPVITITDVTANEVNSGSTKVFAFKVNLSKAGTNTITVQFATADGTATSTDYTSKSGTLSFAPGTVTKTIQVTTKGDNTVEPDETFFVNLSNATFATIGDSQGVGTIVNND